MNKNKKLLCTVLAVIIISLMMASYGQRAPAAPIKLRYSNALPPKHNVSLDQKWWGKEVEKRSNGRIVVEVYQAAELYKHSEVPDAVITGAVRWASIPRVKPGQAGTRFSRLANSGF